GHRHLDRAGAVHFLAHHRFDLAQHAQPQRRPGVQAGGELADHAGLEHQLVADDLGVGGGFLFGAEVELRKAHGRGRGRKAGILPCSTPCPARRRGEIIVLRPTGGRAARPAVGDEIPFALSVAPQARSRKCHAGAPASTLALRACAQHERGNSGLLRCRRYSRAPSTWMPSFGWRLIRSNFTPFGGGWSLICRLPAASRQRYSELARSASAAAACSATARSCWRRGISLV